MKLFKLVALGLSSMMTVSLLGGCSTDTTEVTSGVDTESEEVLVETGEDITIRLLTRMAGTTHQVTIFNDVINEFKEKYPDVTIVDESQGDEGAFNNILQTDISQGTVANIYRVQGVANLANYIDAGLLLNVQPFIDEDPEWGGGFTEASTKYFQVPGYEGTYGVPMEAGLMAFYYNEEIFEEAGIETFPETWDEFLIAIDQLNAIDTIPIAIGGQSTYMLGHIHNSIFYRWLGTDAAKLLGNREMKWTDPEVVETLDMFGELVERGAYFDGAAGMTDDIAMTQFQQGDAAMILTGPWNIGTLTNPELTPIYENVNIAPFPYFEEKPEFQKEDMQIMVAYMVSGTIEGRELELTMELAKMLTDAEAAKRYAEESAFLIPRNDIDLDESKVNPLFAANMALAAQSTGASVDIFDFDPLASMQDRTRNSLAGIFVGGTAETAAAEIQAEIDSAE